MNKLLFICGPTATGKTNLGINLAKKFNGEIVTADSRQIYKGLDVLSGKDVDSKSPLVPLKTDHRLEMIFRQKNFSVGYRLKDRIPVWLVDLVDPGYHFNISEYNLVADAVIRDIWNRRKLPIVVGGSGLYIKSIVDPMKTLTIPPNKTLRKELEQKPLDYLQGKLQELDHERLMTMNDSDKANPRRLIRAIEVAVFRRKQISEDFGRKPIILDSKLMIGLKLPFKKLFPMIDKRVEDRMANNALEEVKQLLAKNYSLFLPALTAIGVSHLAEYLQGKESLLGAINRWKTREHHYADHQMIWFKKDKRIQWYNIDETDYLERIVDKVREWYTSN